MRNILFAVVLLFFSSLASADSVSVPPGINLCLQFNICGTPQIIQVELSGKGTNVWTSVIELHEVSQPDWFFFVDGTVLPPGSVWMAFLWPDGEIGLSTPLTWRPVPPTTNTLASSPSTVDVPEPSSLALIFFGLAVLTMLPWRGKASPDRAH